MKETYLIAVQLYEADRDAGLPTDRCRLCGGQVAESVKGCWELYTQVSVRGYSDPRYGAGNFYGVDAHALQHPEIHGKKNNVAHLLRLHWIFTQGAYAYRDRIPAWWKDYLESNNIPHLDPPDKRGELTIVDVAAAVTPEEQTALMERWARSVHAAWSAHHAWADRELARLVR